MDNQKILDILSLLQIEINKQTLFSETDKKNVIKKLNQLNDSYNDIQISGTFKELYASLVKKGNELIRDIKRAKSKKEIMQKINHYIRYLKAAIYDFNDNIKGLNYYTRTFIIMCIFFMLLAPQFYGILPILFIIPIFAGLKGLKRRNATAFTLTLSVIPMALMVGITWLQFFFRKAVPDLEGTAREILSSLKSPVISINAARMLVIIPSVMSFVLVIASILAAYFGYKYHDMFV